MKTMRDIRRPFYETTYHRDDWTVADAFRPEPGYGRRVFCVNVGDMGQHTEAEFMQMARQEAPERYRLTCVKLYPETGEARVLFSTPPDSRMRQSADRRAGGR